MPLDPVILEALEETLAKQPQSEELRKQITQLVTNWFDGNASEDDVARIVRRVQVDTRLED